MIELPVDVCETVMTEHGVLLLETFQSFQNDQLDVIIILAVEQIGISNGSSSNRSWSTRKTDERPGCFITDGSRVTTQ